MSDLISRRVAIDKLKKHRELFCDNTPESFSKLAYGDKCRVDEIDTAIATIVNMPSADVVEVVRCKECKYNEKGDNESEFWNLCRLRPLVYVPVSDEDYCSRGEKKDDGRNNS